MGSRSSDPDPTAEMRRYRFADLLGSEPLDLDPVAQNRRYPFSRGIFVKESLGFLGINPQSSAVQKYLQTSPTFSV
jgi:hypothetical protein